MGLVKIEIQEPIWDILSLLEFPTN